MPQLWERQPDEGDTAYAAFVVYRDLGSDRSIDLAYRKQAGHQTGPRRAPGSWKRWSIAHAWRARATAWDNRLQAVADKAVEKVVAADATAKTQAQIKRERRDRHVEDEHTVTRMLLRLGADFLREFNGRNLKPKDAIAALKLFHQLGRAANQLPLKVEEDQHEGFDDAMYETSGQLAVEVPAGLVPTMPADTWAKPDLSSAVAADGSGGTPPDHRSRERPDG